MRVRDKEKQGENKGKNLVITPVFCIFKIENQNITESADGDYQIFSQFFLSRTRIFNLVKAISHILYG